MTSSSVPAARYLTKSRFKEALTCPAKLYYTGKKEYPNSKSSDTFLNALAEGGFQVGELAKLYHPGGVEIVTLDREAALSETNHLISNYEKEKRSALSQSPLILFESAISWSNCLVRIDILEKSETGFTIKEVKAKSFDSSCYPPTELDAAFYDGRLLKKGIYKLKSDWVEYIYDIAFQTYVLKNAYPEDSVISKLIFADKSKRATIDGLNQRFVLHSQQGRTVCNTKPGTTRETLGETILCELDVTSIVDRILQAPSLIELEELLKEKIDFATLVNRFKTAYQQDRKIQFPIGKPCKECEYRVEIETSESRPIQSGFLECWKEQTGLSADQLTKPLAVDIWNFGKADELVRSGIYLMSDVQESNLNPRQTEPGEGFSRSYRQWLQVQSAQSSATSRHNQCTVDTIGLKRAIASLKYPLHFIDFETTRTALPFYRGLTPYEQIAFQFSHHVLDKTGQIRHQTQYLMTERGRFPNFDFLRALSAALESTSGSVFRYSQHENTVLLELKTQLMNSKEPDKDALCAFIEDLTEESEQEAGQRKIKKRKGSRAMVDLHQWIVQYYFNPLTQGSTSIKYVLPAVLQSSTSLKEKFGKPVHSLNLPQQIWLQTGNSEKSEIKDPYQFLPDAIRDGGAAMTAYAKMQFTEISDRDREQICQALLRYCELDTLAMVMVFEHLKEMADRKAFG